MEDGGCVVQDVKERIASRTYTKKNSRGCSKLEEFLLPSFFCESPESRCCEKGLASAGGDVVVPLQQQVVVYSSCCPCFVLGTHGVRREKKESD